MSEEIFWKILTVLAVATSLRNFVFVQSLMGGSTGVFARFLKWIWSLFNEPKPGPGGSCVLQPGKGSEGYPDGVVQICDAHGNLLQEWGRKPPVQSPEGVDRDGE